MRSIPSTRLTRALLPVALVVGGVGGGATIAAAIEDEDLPEVHACVNRGLLGFGKGEVRIVAEPGQCRWNEDALSWNQQGVRGEVGPVGPQGPEGPAGEPGSSGDEIFFSSGSGVSFDRGPQTTVLSKELPPGAYVAEAYGDIRATFNAQITCTLPGRSVVVFPQPVDSHSYDPVNPVGVVQAFATLAMTTAFTHDGGAVQLTCGSFSNEGDIRNPALVVRRAASVG